MIIDSEKIEMPKKRALLSSKEITNNKKIRADKDFPSKLPDNNNILFKSSNFKNTEVNNISINVDSGLTTLPSSQEMSNKLDLLTRFQPTIIDKNINNSNNIHLETEIINKRKMSYVTSMCYDEEDPFNYMDIDEIEEPKKKSKKENAESIFPPISVMPCNNKNEQLKYTEINVNNIINPNLIMNLLATAKGNGQFIDPCDLSNKSVRNII